jgi:dTDP-4-dehydrorhamnose 3,5-epimerase
MGFRFKRLSIPDVVLVEADVYADDRGYFEETYKRSVFAEHGIEIDFPQDNASRSAAGVLRGLHFQNPPHAVGKLVGVLKGSVFDVAVDIRIGSPTYGRWESATLTGGEGTMLWVPEGFAHGFLALEPSIVIYKMSGEYAPDHEHCIVWNDPDLAIEWPLSEPILSPKDAEAPRLRDVDNRFTYGA